MQISTRNVRGNREAWLTEATRLLAENLFVPAGYDVAPNLRVAPSWPSRGGLAPKRRVIGQAWHEKCSADGHYEIVISQNVDDPEDVLAILAHEIVHVVVGFKCGHRGPFKKCATAIGLEGKMTATVAGEAFKRAVAPILEELGPYPHGRVGPSLGASNDPDTTGKKVQKGRMRKAHCLACGLTLRLTKKWIEGKRLVCPDANCGGHNSPLVIE